MTERRTAGLAIVAALLVGLGLRLEAWVGTIASDDLTHAYAAIHPWNDPVEHSMPDGHGYDVNARRIGVNLPLAIGAAIAGPTEQTFGTVTLLESLLGILLCAAWAGALGGRRAAVLAAWLAAVSPIEVWYATVFLQDVLFSAGLAGAMAAIAWGARTDRMRWWFASGLAFGYLQYVKENAAILVAALVVVGVVRSIRARRIDRGTVGLVAGVAAIQLLACVYWWVAIGDPLYYVKAWLQRQVALEAVAPMQPFPNNVLRLGLYIGYHQVFGIGLLVAGYFGVRWLRRGDAPPRVRQDIAVIAVLQLALLIHILRWGSSTQRYMMQLSPILIVLGAVGLVAAWGALAPRIRRARYAAVVAATAISLLTGIRQHGRFRADVIRATSAAISTPELIDLPVYAVRGPRVSHYIERTLALLDGYRHDRFHLIDDPATVQRGLIVYSFLEQHPQPLVAPPGRRIFATGLGTSRWVEVYAVGIP
ncbi:MAG: glycosyltransferase family 39 protein [Deltaproteobacteria bacterium]|nr:glycosyltransferase family 39 protein [Deltaproteobacteria bacterium]